MIWLGRQKKIVGQPDTFGDYALGIGLGATFGAINPVGEFASAGGALVGGAAEWAAGGDFLGTGFIGGGLAGGVAGGFGSSVRFAARTAGRFGLRRAAALAPAHPFRNALPSVSAEVGTMGLGAIAGGAIYGTGEGALHGAMLAMFGGHFIRGGLRRTPVIGPWWRKGAEMDRLWLRSSGEVRGRYEIAQSALSNREWQVVRPIDNQIQSVLNASRRTEAFTLTHTVKADAVKGLLSRRGLGAQLAGSVRPFFGAPLAAGPSPGARVYGPLAFGLIAGGTSYTVSELLE